LWTSRKGKRSSSKAGEKFSLKNGRATRSLFEGGSLKHFGGESRATPSLGILRILLYVDQKVYSSGKWHLGSALKKNSEGAYDLLLVYLSRLRKCFAGKELRVPEEGVTKVGRPIS